VALTWGRVRLVGFAGARHAELARGAYWFMRIFAINIRAQCDASGGDSGEIEAARGYTETRSWWPTAPGQAVRQAPPSSVNVRHAWLARNRHFVKLAAELFPQLRRSGARTRMTSFIGGGVHIEAERTATERDRPVTRWKSSATAQGREFQFAAFECSHWAVNAKGSWLQPSRRL